MLVLRLVNHCDKRNWHICAARQEFRDGAIVTLQALCGDWCFGTLIRRSIPQWREDFPVDTLCIPCNAAYQSGLELEGYE